MELVGKIIKGRYKIDKEIAEDKISNLYLANDLLNKNANCAVKFLKNNFISKRIEDIIRFKSEVNRICELRHDNIISIYEIGEMVELHYIVMEYCEYRALSEILHEKKIYVDLCTEYIAQLCRALEYIHNHGIIHRDIRPENILVCGSNIKLTNFGLSHIREFNDVINRDDITTAFAYMSPEQSGMIKRSIDERSDLYSTGVIFYQMLTGVVPFTGDDLCSIVYSQIAKIPDRPSSLNQQVPEILDKIVLKLLEKDPENRYYSASGLLFDLEKYLRGQKEFILGLNDRFIKPSYRTKLIGREKELNKLKDIFNTALKGNGGVCFIKGEAGSGKTKLAEEFMNHVYSKNALLIEGKCFAGDNKTPFGPFKDALNSYINNFRNYSENKKKEIISRIRSEFRDLGEIIIKLNPSMREVIGAFPPLVELSPERENNRFHMIASQFFQRLSDFEFGLVILIEDLQWTDEDSINLLNGIVDGISDHPLVIIGTYRDDEISDNHSLQKFYDKIWGKNISFEEIRLDLFDSHRMNRLLSSMLIEPEENIARVSEYILNKSKGNPFFAIEILKRLIEQGILFYSGERWDVDDKALEKIEIPKSILEIILKRVELLNDDERAIISYASAIGHSFNLELLFKLSGLETSEIVRIIDKAIALHLLELDLQDKGKINFVHDQIKEAFYDNLGEKNREELHLTIAEALEETRSDDMDKAIFDIAYHFIESGDKEKSIQYAIPAARKAKENHANEEAIKYYRLAQRLLEQHGHKASKRWREVLESLIETYLIVGNYDESIEILQEILPFVRDVLEKAQIYSHICSAYFKKGDWKRCEEFGRIGLELLGEYMPLTRVALILSLIKELIIKHIYHLFPKLFLWNKEYPRGKKGQIYTRMDGFYLSLIWSYVLSDNIKFCRFSLRSLNIAESKIGISKALGMAIGGYASLLMAIPFFKRAIAYHKKALKLREELHDEWGIAQSLQWMGYCYEWKGDFTESIKYFTESANRFQNIGDIREYGMCLNGILLHYYLTADYNKARIANEEYYKMAIRSGDKFELSTSWLLNALWLVESGELEKAEENTLKVHALSYKNEIWFAHCISDILFGIIYLEKNKIDESLEYLEKARELFEKNNFLKHYTIYLFTYLAEAYLAEYLKKTYISEKQREFNLKRVRKYCREALRKTRLWPTWYGAANRVNAKYYALIGKNKKADKYFQRSIEIDKRLGRPYELAKSYYEYGLYLSQSEDIKKSKKNLESAYQIFHAIGSKIYAERARDLLGIKEDTAESSSIERLIDKERFSSITRVAQDIGLMSNLDELLHEVLSKAVEITGAQRGFIYISNDRGQIEKRASYPDLNIAMSEYSENIIRIVHESEKNIIIDDAQKDDTTLDGNEQSAEGLRSILCVPMKGRDMILGVFYLDNSLSRGVFTEKELHLLTSFLSQVVYAIENILLHQRLKTSRDGAKQPNNVYLPKEKLLKVIEYINENYTSDISREGLAAYINIHPDNLGRYFKLFFGKKISDYINELRIKETAKMLKETDKSITQIALSVGFEGINTFNRVFYKIMGTTPKNYRKL
jgi:serine/threonine protein kinase/YesN/AraC family two-component response regulator